MNLVVGLALAVALTTLVKLGTRRLFRGRAHPDRRSETRAATGTKDRPGAPAAPGPKAKPKPTARTNGKSQRRR